MFRRRAEPQKPAQNSAARTKEPFTYIERGTTLIGELRAEGRVRVHGVIRGNVSLAGALEVAEAGLVEGDSIEADEVKIIGRVVVKRLVARGKVEIWRGGELIGDVTAASLDIEEGARFTGRSEMAGGPQGSRATIDLDAEPGAVDGGANEVEASEIDGPAGAADTPHLPA